MDFGPTIHLSEQEPSGSQVIRASDKKAMMRTCALKNAPLKEGQKESEGLTDGMSQGKSGSAGEEPEWGRQYTAGSETREARSFHAQLFFGTDTSQREYPSC